MAARNVGDKARQVVRHLNASAELNMEASAALYRAVHDEDWGAVLKIADELLKRNKRAWEIGIYLAADELQMADEKVMEEVARLRDEARAKTGKAI